MRSDILQHADIVPLLRWRPQAGTARAAFPLGLGVHGVHELVAGTHGARAALAGFALAALEPSRTGAGLWLCQNGIAHDHGRLYAPRLQAMRPGLAWLSVQLRKPLEVLWAVEEGVRSGAVSLVVAEVEAADFTATRRLMLASGRHGVPVVLLLPHTHEGATAASARWRVWPRASAPNRGDRRAPGAPRWQAVLERSRAAPELNGRAFDLEYDDETLSLTVVAGMAAGQAETHAPGAEDRLGTSAIADTG